MKIYFSAQNLVLDLLDSINISVVLLFSCGVCTGIRCALKPVAAGLMAFMVRGGEVWCGVR